MLYGETCSLPISMLIEIRMISYWTKIVTSSHNKPSHIVYNNTLLLFCFVYNFNSRWLDNVKSIGFILHMVYPKRMELFCYTL